MVPESYYSIWFCRNAKKQRRRASLELPAAGTSCRRQQQAEQVAADDEEDYVEEITKEQFRRNLGYLTRIEEDWNDVEPIFRFLKDYTPMKRPKQEQGQSSRQKRSKQEQGQSSRQKRSSQRPKKVKPLEQVLY